MQQEIMGAQQIMQMLNGLEAQYKGTPALNPELPGGLIKLNNPDSGPKPKDSGK
jgi:hypothetical protein